MLNFEDFIKKMYEGVADTFLQNRHHFRPDFSDFEDEFMRIKSKEEKDIVIYKNTGDNYIIIKNPKTLENISGNARGLIDNDGNLYIQQFNVYTHRMIIDTLCDLGIIKCDSGIIMFHTKWTKSIPENFITIQRNEYTNQFFVGESNIVYHRYYHPYMTKQWEEKLKEYKPVFEKFFKKCKQKNPQYEFINESIIYTDDYDENNIIYENIDLDDISMKIDGADDEFLSKVVDKFSFLIMKGKVVKNIRPKKINGFLNKDEDGFKQSRKRTTLSVVMNNGNIIVGTLSNGNIAISVNDEILYDVDKKDFTGSKLVDKLSEEYVKYLKSKNYQIKRKE